MKARFLKILYDVEDFHGVEEFEFQKLPRSMHDLFGTRNLKVVARKSPQVDQVFQFQGEACRLLSLPQEGRPVLSISISRAPSTSTWRRGAPCVRLRPSGLSNKRKECMMPSSYRIPPPPFCHTTRGFP